MPAGNRWGSPARCRDLLLAGSETGDGGNDVPAHDLDWRDLIVVHDPAVDRLDAHRGECAQLVDQLSDVRAVFADVEAEGRRSSRSRRSRDPPPRNTGAGSRAWRGMSGRRAQSCRRRRSAPPSGSVFCSPLPAIRIGGWGRVRLCGAVQRPFELDVLAVERSLIAVLALPHAQADLDRLLQQLVALGKRRDRECPDPRASSS